MPVGTGSPADSEVRWTARRMVHETSVRYRLSQEGPPTVPAPNPDTIDVIFTETFNRTIQPQRLVTAVHVAADQSWATAERKYRDKERQSD